MIQRIEAEFFKLFKSCEIKFVKVNAIVGVNLDDVENSSNGSGKSTIKDMITFALYGEVSGVNLRDLIRIGEKEMSVSLDIIKDQDIIRIVRKVPSDLRIYINNKELQANTSTIKQKFIDEQFGTYDYFKKYRMIDTKGINILDLGIISLRKELMTFIDDVFVNIRKNLQLKKLERETYNIDKRFYKFHLSEKRLDILTSGMTKRNATCDEAVKDRLAQQKIVNELRAEIQAKEKLVVYKQSDIKKLNNGYCPLLNTKCSSLSEQLTKVNIAKQKEIDELQAEAYKITETLDSELNYLNDIEYAQQTLVDRRTQTNHRLMKLQEAFKFKEYKYTAKDVMLYAESIKILDAFSGYYINEWLGQLSLIINDLLQTVNMKVEFNPEKDFIKITNENNELKYEQLSSGQKTFLSAIFKLAILIHKGENSGIIVADEGLSSLDNVNVKKLIEIVKTLNFQFILIHHGLSCEDKDINFINIQRKNGISHEQ